MSPSPTPTPAHVRRVGGPDAVGRILVRKDELVKIQNWYLERRYKRCIAVCQQLRSDEIHPLHQAFLSFYEAICHESMGLMAHRFSGHKLGLLRSARESFVSALRCLPLPYDGETPYGRCGSPSSLTFRTPTQSVTATGRADLLPASTRRTSVDSPGSVYSAASYGAGTASRTVSFEPPDRLFETPRKVRDRNSIPHTPLPHHKARLGRSQSSTQTLAGDLVPSPLFSRRAEQDKVEPQTAAMERPLPDLPFHHKARFTVQGSRVVQVPTMRKTAVQTLIARYEGSATAKPSRSPTRTDDDSPSPVTPRFQMIRDAFSPDPHNQCLDTYLSSVGRANYNAGLADLRSQLRKHVAFVEAAISETTRLQTDRAAAKALSKNRSASFWSLEHADAKALSKNRYASFWSLEHAEADAVAATVVPTGADTGRRRGRDDQVPAGRGNTTSSKSNADRIAKLRSQNWVVRKENHGFKGVDWYENLNRQVHRELDDLVTTTRVGREGAKGTSSSFDDDIRSKQQAKPNKTRPST